MKLERRISQIHGYGIFIDQEVEDSIIYQIIPKEFSAIPKKRFARLGDTFVLDEVLAYINHSCDPNCDLVYFGKGYYIKTIKRIKSGEEITLDYTKTELMVNSKVCNCQSNNCKGEFWIT